MAVYSVTGKPPPRPWCGADSERGRRAPRNAKVQRIQIPGGTAGLPSLLNLLGDVNPFGHLAKLILRIVLLIT